MNIKQLQQEEDRISKAIALWSELAQLEAELNRVGGELREAAELAVRLGLEGPVGYLSRCYLVLR